MNRKRFDENVSIDRDYILSLIDGAKNTTRQDIDRILEKATHKKDLTMLRLQPCLKSRTLTRFRSFMKFQAGSRGMSMGIG